jgi:hypothetical protein
MSLTCTEKNDNKYFSKQLHHGALLLQETSSLGSCLDLLRKFTDAVFF